MEKQKNKIIKYDGYALMYINTKYENEPVEVVVDIDDIPKIQQHKWYLCDNKNAYYVVTSIKKHTVRLHRFLLDYTGKNPVDHIDGNTLDNRKQNLRIVDPVVNAQNTHSAGVYKNKSGNWHGVITYFGKRYYSKASKYYDVALEERRLKKEELEKNREQLAKEFYDKKPERQVSPRGNKWNAHCTLHGKNINLGLFNTKAEAIKARDEAEATKKEVSA